MAYTGMAGFRSGLAALEVAGIAAPSRLQQRPETLSVPLPCSFVREPNVRSANVSIGNIAGLRGGALEYVVVVQASNLATSGLNLTAACALMDALDDALRGAIADLGLDEWEMRAQEEPLGTAAYWLIVALIRASG
jgi:hypothetical protein